MAVRTAERDWAAWSRLLPGKVEPERLELLRGEPSKTTVYRIPGGGPGGDPVIAKRCPPETAAIERTVYEEVLPRLPLSAPRYYGAVEAEGGCWILLEDVGGTKFSPLLAEHRLLAARWLGVLHARGGALEPKPPLPGRGTDHYRACLRSGRERILGSLDHPALDAGGVEFLEALASRCDAIESAWPAVEGLAAALPLTLVHGDFRPKNARVKDGAGGSRLLPMDWEMAGWGAPCVDLAPARGRPLAPLVDLDAYQEIARERCPGLDARALLRQTRLGMVLRRLAAIEWASLGLACQWPEKQLACLKVYHAELEEALLAPPWEE